MHANVLEALGTDSESLEKVYGSHALIFTMSLYI